MFSLVSYIRRGHTHTCVFIPRLLSQDTGHTCVCALGAQMAPCQFTEKFKYVAWFAHEQKCDIDKVELPGFVPVKWHFFKCDMGFVPM